MPKYRITTLLLISAGVALWLASFSISGAEDIRQFLMLAVTSMSLTAALCATGTKRAFWGGFAGTLFAFALRSLTYGIVPQFTWLRNVAVVLAGDVGSGGNPTMTNIHISLVLTAWLLTAAAVGWLCAYVYRATEQINKSHPI